MKKKIWPPASANPRRSKQMCVHFVSVFVFKSDCSNLGDRMPSILFLFPFCGWQALQKGPTLGRVREAHAVDKPRVGSGRDFGRTGS